MPNPSEGMTTEEMMQYLQGQGTEQEPDDLNTILANGIETKDLPRFLPMIKGRLTEANPPPQEMRDDSPTGRVMGALGKVRKPGALPIKGTITQDFDTPVDYMVSRKYHGAVDIAAPEGTPIPDLTGGTVILVEDQKNKGYGKQVAVRGLDGVVRRYAHLSKFNVKQGQQIRAGEIIGAVGSSGHSTGPHVHYEELTGGE